MVTNSSVNSSVVFSTVGNDFHAEDLISEFITVSSEKKVCDVHLEIYFVAEIRSICIFPLELRYGIGWTTTAKNIVFIGNLCDDILFCLTNSVFYFHLYQVAILLISFYD